MNRVGKYACSDHYDETELLKMIFELTEKDKMVMWSEGYLDLVIEKLPEYARDILENRKKKWEDTKAFVQEQIERIVTQHEYRIKAKGERKEFALFVMKHFYEYQSLLFLNEDGNLKDADLRKFVYRRKFGSHKRYIK